MPVLDIILLPKKKGALEDLKALMENNRINRRSPWSKAAVNLFEHNFKSVHF